MPRYRLRFARFDRGLIRDLTANSIGLDADAGTLCVELDAAASQWAPRLMRSQYRRVFDDLRMVFQQATN